MSDPVNQCLHIHLYKYTNGMSAESKGSTRFTLLSFCIIILARVVLGFEYKWPLDPWVPSLSGGLWLPGGGRSKPISVRVVSRYACQLAAALATRRSTVAVTTAAVTTVTALPRSPGRVTAGVTEGC